MKKSVMCPGCCLQGTQESTWKTLIGWEILVQSLAADKKSKQLVLVAHAFNAGTWDTEAG